MVTDPIADLLVQIKNAQLVKKSQVVLSFSRLKENLADILKKEGYLKEVKSEGQGAAQHLVIQLKYQADGRPALVGFRRLSKPGRRLYRGCHALGPVRSGLGLAIVSTSAGVMVAARAKKKGLGGEMICEIW